MRSSSASKAGSAAASFFEKRASDSTAACWSLGKKRTRPSSSIAA